MIRSMFTAIGSLKLNQYYMDVIADNLANANTYGFKANRFTFQDQYSQLLSTGAAPGDSQGGINPTQIGLGTRLGTISPNFTQGSMQTTGRNTDLAIQGDGFFMYSDGSKNYYSRDGVLEMDAFGYLVHGASGMKIQGWQVGTDGKIDPATTPGEIKLPLGSTLAQATNEVSMGGNLNAERPTTGADSSYSVSMGVFDSLGNPRDINIKFTHTDTTTRSWSWEATYDADGDGTGAPVALGNGTIQFDANGQPTTGDPNNPTLPPVTLNLDPGDGAGTQAIQVDFSSLTQLATEDDVAVLHQNGLGAGDLTSFYVSTDNGEIYGLYSNGMQQVVGQLALARFVNPAGLIHSGQNMFDKGLNSGDPIVGTANTGGRGVVVSGYLEGSNVDMAQEFTNMILAQRGFQASSRIITTSDEMLQELVNIKR